MQNRTLACWPAAALFLAAGCGVAGFDSFAGPQRFKQEFHYSYDLAPGGRLSLDNFNGGVEIIGWEKNAVDISGVKYASTEDLLKQVQVEINALPEEIRVRTIHPSGRRGGSGARYVLRVPHRTLLDRIQTTNGSIRAESVQGGARLTTTNGSVHALKLRGELDIQTTNGAIEATGQEGAARLHTTNGAVNVDGLRGALDASTTNGRIRARILTIQAGQRLRALTSNGSIELTVESFKDNDVRASTSNGSITLRLPAGLNARLRAATTNSNITTGFDVQAHGGTLTKKRLDAQVGAGGPLIELTTTNGSIKILKL